MKSGPRLVRPWPGRPDRFRRHCLGMTFSSQEEDTFKARIDAARRILFLEDSASKRPDKTALLNVMLDFVVSISPTVPSTLQPTQSFLETAGIYNLRCTIHGCITF